MVTTTIGSFGAAYDGIVQPDGKLVAAGCGAGSGMTLARYLGDPVDPNAPDTTLVAGPSGPTNVTTPSFTFTSSRPGSTFECKLDTPAGAGSYAPCTSPQAYTTTANGAYTFSVRATSAGTTDAVPATRTFTDRHGPAGDDDPHGPGRGDERPVPGVHVLVERAGFDVRVSRGPGATADVLRAVHDPAPRRTAPRMATSTTSWCSRPTRRGTATRRWRPPACSRSLRLRRR